MSLLNASFPEAHHHFNELPLPPPMHPSYLPPPPRPPHHMGPPPSQREPTRDYPRPATPRTSRSTLSDSGSRQTHTFHAVLDYDYDDGADGGVLDAGSQQQLQQHGHQRGPILVKNGSVPVVPLYSYPALDNGTLVQIPSHSSFHTEHNRKGRGKPGAGISLLLTKSTKGANGLTSLPKEGTLTWRDLLKPHKHGTGPPAFQLFSQILWTALSLALGLEIRGEVIRGVPCIKRFHQLFCPTAGNSYPIDRIELFIDENKALMKRMYGEFQMNDEYGPPAQEVFETQSSSRNVPLKRRSTEKREASSRSTHHDVRGQPISEGENTGSAERESPVSNARFTRQSSFRGNQSRETGRVDACESKVEIVTPYWASNSAGKIRAIVNTQHFEQAIHQEVCSKVQTIRCSGDCGCEQKYKWHRLLAYDPDNDCKGIFMDWFLFPSCCVCRCSPIDGH